MKRLLELLQESQPGVRILEREPLGSGLQHTARVLTTAGELFVKWTDGGPSDIFTSEAASLRTLAGTALVVPKVVAADEHMLVLELLRPGPPDDERLGRGLAELHRRSAPGFGFDVATYCGLTRQDNTRLPLWVDFFRERRLLALARRLGDVSPYERLAERLPVLLPASAPSLIHGDLWSGNVLATARGPALVDPSCSYADREMELGITTLFGGLSPRALSAYEEAWPLPAGWRERNGLYQIYHLLNHALLFGGHYAEQARRLAVRYTG